MRADWNDGVTDWSEWVRADWNDKVWTDWSDYMRTYWNGEVTMVLGTFVMRTD